MKDVCIIKLGDIIPIDGGDRQMRSTLLASALRMRGADVSVIRPTFCHHQKKFISRVDSSLGGADGVKYVYLEAGGYSGHISVRRIFFNLNFALKLFFYLQKRCRVRPPSLVVYAFPPVEAGIAVLFLSWKYKFKFVLDVQDIWPDAWYLKFRRLPKVFLECIFFPWELGKRVLFSCADDITSVSGGFLSRALRQSRRSRAQKCRVFVLGYPIKQLTGDRSDSLEEFEFFEELARAKREGVVIFSYVGGFGESYQLDLVVNVANRLCAISGAMFVFVGDGLRRQQLIRGVMFYDKIRFVGWRSANFISRLLRLTDVGLVPCDSDIDTLPNKLFEYLAHGVPVVSSLLGEAETYIARRQVGLSYMPGDEAGLLRLLEHVVSNPEARSELRRRAAGVASEVHAGNIYEDYAAWLLGSRE